QATSALEALERRGIPLREGVAGQSGTAGDVTWHVLAPGELAPGTGPNDASVVVQLASPGISVLALGDLETEAQDALARELASRGIRRPARAVVMAHHGSARQSAALAELLDPEVLLVGVGEGNSYGHPAPSALA